jgi:hypothetical protein
MPTSAAPTEDLTNPETGQPVDLGEIKFVSLTGNQLTVYLPEELEWYRGPDGERRAREIGGNAVNFQHGIFPPGDQSVSYQNAKLLIEHDQYGDLFKIAARKFDVEATGGQPPDRASGGSEPDDTVALGDEVVVNGQAMSMKEALDLLAGDDTAGEKQGGVEAEGQPPVEDQIDDVPTEPAGSDYEVLSGPTNKTGALEALAERGVDLDEAPTASATTERLQRFAMAHGYIIEKYDVPE